MSFNRTHIKFFIYVNPQRFFIVVTALHIAIAVKPPNYVEKPKVPDKVSLTFLKDTRMSFFAPPYADEWKVNFCYTFFPYEDH